MKIVTATRVAALALGLSLVAGQAFADPQEGRRHRGDDNTATQPQDATDQNDRRGHRNKGETPPPAAATPAPAAAAPVVLPNAQNNGRRGNWRNNNQPNNNPVVQNNDRRGWGNNDRGNWNRQDRRRHVDVARYNRNFNAPHRFRVGTYREPYGYSYRRYRYGQHLPRSYYGRNFWLLNFISYGLFAPPSGYIWVRYGPDALLIDEYTGEIVQVQYDVFYS